MNTTTLHTAATSPAGNNLLETFLGLCLITLLGVGAWSLFASMPAYGGQPTPPPATAHFSIPALAPLCFDRTREQVQAQGVEAGCPTDPMAYRPATLRQVKG